MAISLQHVTKTYSSANGPAVDGLSLDIPQGHITTLLGPSGCGKTTTLRLIAGFERPEQGSIAIAGRTMADNQRWVPPEKRGIGMVFQDYALFPHLNVERNTGFGLKGPDLKKKVQSTLDLVGLGNYLKAMPHELSGGQQQRVALARALIRDPLVILFDEPFSNLDTDLREQMRQEVVDILQRAHATAVFVTHDQREALAISDQIVVMKDGRIQQQGSPREIYQYPETAFVASFVGQSNLLPGTMGTDGYVMTALGPIPCHHTHGRETGEPVTLSIRPDSFEMDPDGELEGTILRTVYTGEAIDALVTLGQGSTACNIWVHIHPEEQVRTGTVLRFTVLPHFVAVIRGDA